MYVRRAECTALAVLILVVTLAGCARTRTFDPAEAELPSAYPNHSGVQVASLVHAATTAISSFKARAALSIDSPQRGGRFTSEIRARRGDSLFISISPGLGIEAVRILLTADSVFVYDRIGNSVRYGSRADAEGAIPIPIGGDEIAAALLGQMVPEAGRDWQVRADEGLYFLTGPDDRESYVVDPSIWRVVRHELRDAAGRLVEERRFEEYSDVDGHVLPLRLIFRRPLDETTLVLTYRDIDPDADGLSFDLRVRSGARWEPVAD